MRIAQIAPLYESVPPKLYGGTERIISFLTEELVANGHDVTLFASGDSDTRARLIACSPRALRLDESCVDPMSHHILMLEKVRQRAGDFDILHNHLDFLPFPLFRGLGTPTVTTLHGRLDIPDLQPLFDEFRDMPLISISNAQRQPLPRAGWRATVYHGLPRDLYAMGPGGNYLVFLGRISPEKGLDKAIEIARRTGFHLKVAAKVDKVDREYFQTVIKPLLSDSRVDYLGEITEAEKMVLLGNALALLFPVDWPEPFGIVLIEAMACGTPSIAFNRGSVPEVVADGISGFIVDDLQGAAQAVEKAAALDRRSVRRSFEQRFTAQGMTEGYLSVFAKCIDHLNVLPSCDRPRAARGKS